MADKEKSKISDPEDVTIAEKILPDQDEGSTAIGSSSLSEESEIEESDLDIDEQLEEVVEDEDLSLKNKVINFLQEKIPFLYVLYLKITKQEIQENDEDVEEEQVVEEIDEQEGEESDDEPEAPKEGLRAKVDATIGNIRAKLLDKMPFLEKVPFLKTNKKSVESQGKVKPQRKKLLSKQVTYAIFIGLIAWLLFDEGFTPKPENELKKKVSNKEKVIEKENQQVNSTEVKPTEVPEPAPVEQAKPSDETSGTQETVDPEQPPHETTISENNETAIVPDTTQPPADVTTVATETVSENTETPNTPDIEQPSVDVTTVATETISENTVTVITPDSVQLPEETPPVTTESSSEVISTQVDKTQVSEDTPGQETINPKTAQPGKAEIQKTKNLDTEIKDIIEKVEEKYADKEDYESAPDYSKVGRGLVYNCKNKHWSCLNRTNYHQCRKNQIFFTKLKALPECVVFDVYYADEDCQVKQKEMINKLIPVPACTDSSGN